MFIELQLDDFRISKNQKIKLGKAITAIAGHNATGKSTILGILGNSSELKSKYGTTITDKQFKTEFSELFKGSKIHDKASGSIGFIEYHHPAFTDPMKIGLRVTWQKWTRESENKNRFRILNNWGDPASSSRAKTAKKLPLPSFYLGLSRLYPLGENEAEVVEERRFKSKLTQSDLRWLLTNYKNILSIEDTIESISNYEINKKRSGGVNTPEYDYLSNSSGQDNLMQILYLLLSFIKLHSEWDELARLWGYNRLIGLMGIINAYIHGCQTLYEMAAYLDVTEEYLREAIFCYRNKYGVYKKIDNYVVYFEPCLKVCEILD